MSKTARLSKNDSLVIKGVAILIMMWHHCFLNEGRFVQYDLSLFPFSQPQILNIASFFKVCVSLFAFVSGYGLYCSLDTNADTLSWYKKRYIRSFSDYWLIVLLACGICQLLNGLTSAVYFEDSAFNGVIYILFSVLGVSSLFKTPLLVGTWWYMSAALVYILLAPLLYWIIKRFSSIACIGVVLVGVRAIGGYPGSTHYLSFLLAFFIGMACANDDFIARISNSIEKSLSKKVLVIGLVVAMTIFCYKFNVMFPTDKFWDIKWGLFVPIYVLGIVITVAKIPYVNNVLRFFGEWSADIFLIHTFVRGHYGLSLVYAEGHFSLVMVRLIALTLLVVLAFRLFKRVIRYDALVSRLIGR